MSVSTAVERIHVDHDVARRLGDWTAAGRFEIRARDGVVVVDLRARPERDEIELRLDLRHAVVKLLVAEDAEVDAWDLRRTGRGRTKDHGAPRLAPAAPSQRIRLHGVAHDSEIRVQRGGVARITAMFSREYLEELRRVHRQGGLPTIDDPAPAAAARKH
ncbi:hypothetical protein [Peterkaempfera griseoplana]|uniref:hypothetical protein n=1 Tax=Peterkaempfera griseoplana TaxID=66896 RepID=UPI0006E2AA9A|nr:hypothetical protein [Peterkaempfera griseoplana]